MSESLGSQDPPALPSIYSSCNGKLLLAAVVCLALVVSFVLLLHVYARCFLRPRRRDPLDVEGHLFLRGGRRSFRVEALPAGYLGAAVFFAAAPDGAGGLDAAAIASLPVFVYRKGGGKEEGWIANQGGKGLAGSSPRRREGPAAPPTPECAVCLSEMEDGEVGRELPGCGHCFHVECIDMWLAARPTCPVCRAAVKVPEAETKGQPEIGAVPAAAAAAAAEVDTTGMPLAENREELAEGRRSTSCALCTGPTIQVVIEQPPPAATSSCSTSHTHTAAAASSSSTPSSSSSNSAASTTATSLGCSLKRMLSRSKSDSRKVFPSAAAAAEFGENRELN